MEHKDREITTWLRSLASNRTGAMDRLLPLIYGELRTLARSRLRAEREAHTLSTTGLVQNYLAALHIYRQDTTSLDSELRATLHYVRALVETGDQDLALAFAQQALQRIDSTVDPSIRQELEDLAKLSVNGDGKP